MSKKCRQIRMQNFDSPTKVGMEADISSGTLEYFFLMAFHTLSLLYFPLLHFPPLRYAPAFSTPAFSAPPSHRLRIVRRLVTARSSSLRRVPGTLGHPASLRLRHSAPSSVVWKSIFLPRHSLNFSNCAHRILFCFLTLKSVLEVIFRLLMTL